MTKIPQYTNKKPAGRKLVYAYQDSPMDTYAIRLTAWHARHGRTVRGDTLSDGVRALIEDYVLRNEGGEPKQKGPQLRPFCTPTHYCQVCGGVVTTVQLPPTP